jgi:hypothetical protein
MKFALTFFFLFTQTTIFAREKESFEILQRSLIQSMAEKENCKKDNCGDRPSIFNLFESDKDYSKRVSKINSYNICILECDGKAQPVQIEKLTSLQASLAKCEKDLPKPFSEFFNKTFLSQYNQDVKANASYIKYPTADGSIFENLEKKHTLCQNIANGKYDKVIFALYLNSLKTCQKNLAKLSPENESLKKLRDIDYYIKGKSNPNRFVASVAVEVLSVERKLVSCNNEIAIVNSSRANNIDESSRGSIKPQSGGGTGSKYIQNELLR